MRKRGSGDGNVRRRPNGTWEARIRGVDENGRAVRRSIYGKTRGEVQKKLAKLTLAHGAGLPVDRSKTTVEEWVAYWLENHTRRRVRPRTFSSYEGIFERHIKGSSLASLPIAKLRVDQVQIWVNWLCEREVPPRGKKPTTRTPKKLSPRRVHRIHQVLRASLTTAERQGLVDRNVARLVDLPRAPQREVTPLDVEQTKVFLKAITGDPMEAFFLVCIGCGLRRGECLGLRWQDVDLDAGSIIVAGAIQRRKGEGIVRVEPKTARSGRTLPAPERVVRALRERRKAQLEERLAAGSEWQDTGYVFTSPIGTPLDGQNVVKEFRAILDAAELPRVRLHDLRHGAATLWLAAGVHPRVVMELLGHSQIALTMDTHSHVMPAALKDAAAKMDDALFSD